jgi:mannose-6-phosphate isomerase-like protein (cupin superfamily)
MPHEHPEVALRAQLERCIATFRTRVPDWDAFADARVPGYRRAQMRYIGSGASGKPDPQALAAQHFTLSIMHVPVGEGNAAHTHEVEEVFFVLQGHLTVFIEDEQGHRVETVLGPWDCISCPAQVIHGFHNRGLEPVYTQVMLGKAAPDLMTYVDAELQNRRAEHLA